MRGRTDSGGLRVQAGAATPVVVLTKTDLVLEMPDVGCVIDSPGLREVGLYAELRHGDGQRGEVSRQAKCSAKQQRQTRRSKQLERALRRAR